MEPKIIVDYLNEVGEGPLWHPYQKRLYWVDITGGKMFWYEPSTKTHDQFFEGKTIGGFTIQKDGSFLLFMENGSIASLKNNRMEYLVSEIEEERGMRFNDVVTDPQGRVFAGTMHQNSDLALKGEKLGNLYRIDKNMSINKVLEGTKIPNGMGFSLNHKIMYFTDSGDKSIYSFDYEKDTGNISSQKTLITVAGDKGLPDGMTVDSNGDIWSASAGGYSLNQYSANGIEKQSIKFPAFMVSSVTFGGDNLDDIFVTTIGGENKKENGSGAGALFHLNLGIKGNPEFLSEILI